MDCCSPFRVLKPHNVMGYFSTRDWKAQGQPERWLVGTLHPGLPKVEYFSFFDRNIPHVYIGLKVKT